MNEINSAILQAVDTVINARLAKQNKDTTITATIHDNSDAVFGTYTVKYQNSLFDVYSNDTNKIYKKDESVYVLVPSGDLSKRKFILGSAKNLKTESYIENTDPNSLYNLVGPELHQLYNVNQAEIGIPGYHTFTHDYHMDGENKVYDFIYQSPEGNDDNKLYEYSKQYEYIQFSADFKYMPAADIAKCGNYGLAIGFYSEPLSPLDKEGNQPERNIIEYRFDTESMYGNPFILHDYLNYTVTVKANKGTLYELAYITLFSEGFTRGDTITADDIFVKNVKIQFAELRQESEEYTVNILTPYGIYIDDSPVEEQGNKFIELMPLMKKQNVALNGIKYSWFEKNGKINSESDLYDPLGGRGWAKILDQDILLGDKLHYTASADWFSKHLKLVATYNDDIRREKEITIYKSATTGRYSISYEKNVENQITLKVVDAENNLLIGNDYSFVWEYKMPNGITMSLSDNGNTISFNQAEMNKTDRTYYCYLYKNDVLFDILNYTVALTIEIKEDITVQFTFGSNDINHGTFLYNENGYIEVEEFLLDRELGFIVKKDSEELKFGSYKYKWILDVNEEINNDYLTDNIDDDESMLIYLKDTQLSGPVSGTSEITKLRYRIRPRFDRQKIKNTVTLEIIYNDTKKYFTFTFVFTKQGDPGTNGTDYQLRITQISNNLILDPNKTADYKIELYYNGELIESPECTISIDKKYWGSSVLTDETGAFDAVIDKNILSVFVYQYGNKVNLDNLYKNILNLRFKVGDYYLYYELPIQINTEELNARLNLDNFNIVYDSTGHSPSYPKISIKSLYTGNSEDIKNITVIPEEIEKKLISYNVEEDCIEVNNYFESDKNIAALKVELNNGAIIYAPLIATLNKYSLMHINDWNGNSVVVDGDKGVVYAPQIAAGDKNDDNQFTGVLMGEYVVDQENKGIGLWGFQEGQSTFGFRDTGSAYIGHPTGARLEFDGNNGFIQNAGFIENTSGMQLDFVNGSIWTPSFYLDTATDGKNNQFVFTLGEGNNSKFLIKTADSKKIFEASEKKYILQSANWDGSDSSTTAGLKIDLTNGYLDSPYVYIDGSRGKFNLNINADNTTSQFTISAQSVGEIDEQKQPIYKTIFKANDNDYWLKSLNYTGSDLDDDIETSKGLYINLNDGYIKSPKFKIDSGGNAYFGGELEAATGSFKGALKAATGTFRGELKAAKGSFSGKITASEGKIGGWMIDGNKLVGGNIEETIEEKTDENGVTYTETTYTGSGTILDGNTGNITITGTLESKQGNIILNGIHIDAETTTGDNTIPGTITFETKEGKATINLKQALLTGNSTSYTAGAMQLNASNGISIDTYGTIYLASRYSEGDNKDKPQHWISISPTGILMSSNPTAVAVFG